MERLDCKPKPVKSTNQNAIICIRNSMIYCDIWHKYHEPLGEWNLRQFWNITRGIYAKYHVQIMLSFVYTTTHKRFVIFTRRDLKLSWNTTALSQSKCRNFSCSNIAVVTRLKRYVGLQWTIIFGSLTLGVTNSKLDQNVWPSSRFFETF